MTDRMDLESYLGQAGDLLRRTATPDVAAPVDAAVDAIATAFANERPLLICGNGGSAADSLHIAGELVGRFLLRRRALRAISLAADPAVLTAWSNDEGYDTVFARQVEALGAPGGVLWGLSTSGRSANVIAAFAAAREIGMTTIALTGAGGGDLAASSDILIAVPSRGTPEIQQVHMCLYHYICQRVEARCAGVAPEP